MRYLLLLGLFGWVQPCIAQHRGEFDTIRLNCLVIGKDTIPYAWLRNVDIVSILTEDQKALRARARAEREAYNQLRFNVYVVYPYAVKAGWILHDIDSVLGSLYSKEAKQVFKRRKEDELNRQFKNQLEDLSITQGQILVKLIARQTGKPCYQIIKELKGGVNARIWQTVAILFDNNLKNHYDPYGDDEAIESVVEEIESKGHFVPR